MKLFFLFLLFLTFSCQNEIVTISEPEPILVPPDISPEHKFGSTSFVNGQERNFATIIRNFGGPTTGPVTFDIQKMQIPFDLYFFQADTSYVIGIDTVSLDNPSFTFTEQAVRYRFTIDSVPANSMVVVGYKIKACASCTGNATYQSRVINGSGGELNFLNNVKITHLSID